MTAEQPDDIPLEFSLPLRTEVAKALGGYLTHGDAWRARLERATQRVCTEAHALALSPERMMEAMRRLFERTPVAGGVDPERRHAAWEEFMHGCMAAYFNADEREP